MSISIANITIEDPVFLAPMSGISDQPFRRLVRQWGCGLVFSEMIASEAMIRQTRQSMKMATGCDEESPMAVQLAGCDPEVMAEAARLNQDRGAALIDINFGCPVKKVVNKLAGSALMRDEKLAGDILSAVVRAVDVPVTLKMRLGWDDENRNAPRLARIAEDSGIKLITVHGRTRCQLYNGSANWQAVAEVVASTSLPVVVNGDIATPEDARMALQKSGAQGVMVGRATCGRPWLIRRIQDYLRTGALSPEPCLEERCACLLQHYDSLLSHYGREQGVRIARKHIAWSLHGLRGANAFRERINKIAKPEDVQTEIRRVFAENAEVAAA
ncbi:tRNA dihydrouridine synthase DusB [Fodinicurvata halophila]|uniref:tRNA-dihydrouridine synthase n=1 Tax=Fodinicurvata halophila TaxID=1419723 RepID=A0ABV8UJP3_9PROT